MLNKDYDKKEEIMEAVRRLCHFAPPTSGENLPHKLHEFLIENVLLELGSGQYSIAEIKESVNNLFRLTFEEEEVESAIGRLIEAKSVVLLSPGLYSLNINKSQELSESKKKYLEFEEKILKEWLGIVDRKYPGLTNEDLEALKEDLTFYSKEIFAKHGAECVDLIYAGNEKVENFINDLKKNIFDVLPERTPRLHKIRIIELPNFFKDAPPNRKSYIARFLDSTFIIYMLSIDKVCSKLVQKQFENSILFLDTNFLYRLLGIDGRKLKTAAERAVKIAQDLGISLKVSTRTIEEWKASIKKAGKNLNANPLPTPELAQIGAEFTTERDFTTAYWREYAESGVPIDDFLRLYEQIEDLLKEYNTEISDKFYTEIKEDPRLDKEISKLNIVTDYSKPREVAEHDAFHRLLILRLRGDESSKSFVTTKAWFLTCDTSLPSYDREARGSRDEISFCILPNHWIQTIRPFLPRTEDFDEVFVDLFTSPYLKTYGDLPSDIAQKILGRISMFKNHSPELAVKVLTDGCLSKELRQTTEEEKVFALIDSTTAKVAEEFREERDKFREQFEATKKEKDEVERKLAEEKTQREKERTEFEEKTKKTEDTVYTLEGEIEQEKDTRLKLEKKMKWIPACFIWIIIVIVALFVPWGNLYSWVKLLVVGGIIVGGIGALSFPFGRSRISKTLGLIAIVCSILSFVWGFIKK